MEAPGCLPEPRQSPVPSLQPQVRRGNWHKGGRGSGLASRGPSCPTEAPPRRYHGDIGLEDLLDELVSGGVDQLDDVSVQGVPVLLQEAWAGATSSHALSAVAASACLTRLSPSPNPRCLSQEDPQTPLIQPHPFPLGNIKAWSAQGPLPNITASQERS